MWWPQNQKQTTMPQDLAQLFLKASKGEFDDILQMKHSELSKYVNVTNEKGITLLLKLFKACIQIFIQTPLHIACKLGRVNIVKLLLHNRGIRVNDGYVYSSFYKDSCGHVTTSPLYTACREGNLGIVKLLLETKSIDPNCGEVHDRYNAMSCLGISIYKEKWEIASLMLNALKVGLKNKKQNNSFFLFKRTNLISELLLTCAKGNEHFLKELLESKLFNVDSCFPLHYCILNKNMAMAKLLIDHGASVSLNFEREKGCGYVLDSFCSSTFAQLQRIKAGLTPDQLAKDLNFDIKSLIGGKMKNNLGNSFCHLL